jgi:hypothetical protein
LNILVPALVRDRNKLEKKNIDDENEITGILIEINNFDFIAKSYTGHELMVFLD